MSSSTTPKGLTKQYLRFNPTGIFGICSSRICNAVFLKPSKFIATGGTNIINLWDTRFKRKLVTFDCESPAVILKPAEDSTLLAVGHLDGQVSIYDLKDKSEDASPDPNVTFEGHRSEITTLLWNDFGTLLASGSKDTNVILWDCVTESGITKLKGHKGPITQLQFWRDSKYIISSSLDSTIRIWNMITFDCVHTVPVDSKVWDFCVWNEEYLIIGEANIRLIRIMDKIENERHIVDEFNTVEEGTILRHSSDKRTSQIKMVDNRHLIAIGPKRSEIELFRLNTTEEIKKRLAKRRKKYPDREATVTLKDLVYREKSIYASEDKLKSIDAIVENSLLKIICNLSSNRMELITYDTIKQEQASKLIKSEKDEKSEKSEASKLLEFDGHTNVIKGIAISSDKTAILTVSSEAVKLWSRQTLFCIQTITHEYPLDCCKFCPGDRHFIAGASSGHLIMGDFAQNKITQAELLNNDDSDMGTKISDICLYPNGQRFAVCNENYIIFFEFTIINGVVGFKMIKRLEIKEQTICVKISPDMKYVAVGLLDSTIKVFFLDTCKHHLTLYGHNQPTIGIDISSDSRLLVSCSGDKTVKVWGLDFGDCHRSMVHHGEGLVGCGFIENKHLIASVGKHDVNIYDGDNFERIQTLKGHVDSGATCMTVGGLHIASAGRDQTIRLYSRGDEILVLSDEREREREELLEKESIKERPDLPGLQTGNTEIAADKLIEGLDTFEKQSDSDPLIVAYGAKSHQEFIYKLFTTIKSSELDQSLMLLPVSYVRKMVPAIHTLFTNFPMASELAVKLLAGLMKFHFTTLTSMEQKQLQDISELAGERLGMLKDTSGFNLAGLKFIYDRKLENIEVENFRELIGERKRTKKRKQDAIKRACLLLQS